jgi:hypothetical protein
MRRNKKKEVFAHQKLARGQRMKWKHRKAAVAMRVHQWQCRRQPQRPQPPPLPLLSQLVVAATPSTVVGSLAVAVASA